MIGAVEAAVRGLLVLPALALAAQASTRGPEPQEPALCTADTPEVRLCYREHAWVPTRLEPAEDGSSPSRPWPVATMEARRPLRLGEVDLPAGCYAWVCAVDAHGRPALELRRLRVPEALLPDPDAADWVGAEPVWSTPIRFDTSLGVSPRLTIGLSPTRGGVRLEVRYGEGHFVRELLRQ